MRNRVWTKSFAGSYLSLTHLKATCGCCSSGFTYFRWDASSSWVVSHIFTILAQEFVWINLLHILTKWVGSGSTPTPIYDASFVKGKWEFLVWYALQKKKKGLKPPKLSFSFGCGSMYLTWDWSFESPTSACGRVLFGSICKWSGHLWKQKQEPVIPGHVIVITATWNGCPATWNGLNV